MRWPVGKEKRFAGTGPGWDRLFIEKCAKDAKKLAKWKASGYNKRIETHRKKEILMLDIKVIRQDPERVKAAMKSRNKDMDKEIDEILEMSDRILVCFEGQIMGEYSGKNPPIEEISLAMTGK
jgi:hypothetical protein